MSHNILYRSMFLKVKGDKYIPIREGGSNNTWNPEEGRNARSWCNIHLEGMYDIYGTKENILNSLKLIHNDVEGRYEDYTDKSFGWHAGITIYGKTILNTSWNDFFNFYNSGFKKAITFEEAKNLNISIYLNYYNLVNKKNIIIDVNSEEELFNRIEEIRSEGDHTIWVGYYKVKDETYKLIKAIKRNKRADTIIETNLGFVKSLVNFKPQFTDKKEEAYKFSSNVLEAISDLILCDENPRCTFIRC